MVMRYTEISGSISSMLWPMSSFKYVPVFVAGASASVKLAAFGAPSRSDGDFDQFCENTHMQLPSSDFVAQLLKTNLHGIGTHRTFHFYLMSVKYY